MSNASDTAPKPSARSETAEPSYRENITATMWRYTDDHKDLQHRLYTAINGSPELGTEERKNFVPDKKLIEELVDEGAENTEVWCHAMEEYLDCPLVVAITRGHYDIVELLLEKWPEDIDRDPGINKVSGWNNPMTNFWFWFTGYNLTKMPFMDIGSIGCGSLRPIEWALISKKILIFELLLQRDVDRPLFYLIKFIKADLNEENFDERYEAVFRLIEEYIPSSEIIDDINRYNNNAMILKNDHPKLFQKLQSMRKKHQKLAEEVTSNVADLVAKMKV